MQTLLLAGWLLFSWPGHAGTPELSSVSAQTAAYSKQLGLALLGDVAALPEPPAQAKDLHAEAHELLLGRAPETTVHAYEQRLRVFCSRLDLSESQRQAVFERLRGRLRGSALPGSTALEKSRLDGGKSKVLGDKALAMSEALGRTRFEAVAVADAPPPHGDPAALAPGAPRQAGLRINAVPPAGTQPAAPIPLEELETWMEFGPPPKTAGSALAGIGLGPRQDPAVVLSKQAIMHLQSTPEGREVIQELQREYAKSGRKVVIRAVDVEGSAVVQRRGIEGIDGIRGLAYYNEGIYEFNRKFLEFKDKDVAMETLCGNMSHELRHLVSHAQIKRLLPDSHEVFKKSLLDEQRARLSGYLVAARLNSGKATDYSEEAKDLARKPGQYWDGLKRGPYYVDSLEADEMRDPVQAYTDRLAVIQTLIDRLSKSIAGLPKLGAKLQIMEDKEGLKARLTELRSQYDGQAASDPERLKRYEAQLAKVKSLRDRLMSPQGEELLKRFQAAADDPEFRRLQQAMVRDEKALIELLAGKPLPVLKPTPGQLDWDEFNECVERSRRDHPAFWSDFRARFSEP
ncbi:MAG: hypothetical protein HY922_07935 [Elusimicrobia bacterium]|nr:hypothetical protein [Elusimicrobiota bacterium]